MTSSGILVTAEAKLIGLGYILCRFEVKTESFISYEDINTQFMHFQGQNVESQRNQKAACEIGLLAVRGIIVISHVTVLRLS